MRKKSLGFYAIQSALKVMYDMFHSILHNKVNYFFALLGSFMFFILFNNWSGLIPGVGSVLYTIHHAGEIEHVPLFRSGTADLNTTIALAGISVIITQIFGFQFIGAQKHLGKYFIFTNPIMFFVGILELLLEVARIISFSFRLFGNIFAGEVLLTLLPFLLPLALSFVTSPLYLMEIFVGFIQAFVFVILSTIFINMATSYEH
jgi:F-type H+-transporting ATPase subunit a